jgi:hypothetical protein
MWGYQLVQVNDCLPEHVHVFFPFYSVILLFLGFLHG